MTQTQKLCPVCGEGHLHESICKKAVEYKGQPGELELLYSVCDACGSEQAASSQLRANKRAMVAFKKQVDGLLAGVEVRALRERLGINQAEAAKIFGGGPVAFSKYESDDVAQSEAMDKLLRLTLEIPQVFNRLANDAGIVNKNAGQWDKLTTVKTKIAHSSLRIIFSSPLVSDGCWRKAG